MMHGDRDPGYSRFTRSLNGAPPQQIEVQPSAYRAVTLGPRHTFGPVLLQSADFGVAPIYSRDLAGNGNFDLEVMARRGSILVTPRAPLVGYFDAQMFVGLPTLPAVYMAAGLVVPPVVDLLFWHEHRETYPYRGDDAFTFMVAAPGTVSVPCFARRRVSLTIECTTSGSVDIAVGGASATNVHPCGPGTMTVALTAGQIASFDTHELIDVGGVSPWVTPAANTLATSRPDWLHFFAGSGEFAITVLASDDR